MKIIGICTVNLERRLAKTLGGITKKTQCARKTVEHRLEVDWGHAVEGFRRKWEWTGEQNVKSHGNELGKRKFVCTLVTVNFLMDCSFWSSRSIVWFPGDAFSKKNTPWGLTPNSNSKIRKVKTGGNVNFCRENERRNKLEKKCF